MMEDDNSAHLQAGVRALVGLPLNIVRSAADMKIFHFGTIVPHPLGKGTVGSHALHVQCPWRIVSENAVITGRSDQFAPPLEAKNIDDEDTQSGNLQLVKLFALMKGYDNSTRSIVNSTEDLIVLSASSDQFGGLELTLSGGYRLQIFPDCSSEEDWRFIEVGGPHIVVEGGRATSIE
jgi:hypothetical protein